MPAAWRVFTMGAGLLLTVSCADITPSPESSFNPDPNTVVLYGRFELGQNQEVPGFCLDLYHESTKKEQFIPFRRTDPVYCVVSEGGWHDIVGVALINQITHRVFRYTFRGKDGLHPIPFEARSGTAIYVGDVAGFFNNTVLTMEFGVRSISDNFSETTKTFHEKYPHLASLPVRSIFDQTNQTVIMLPASNTVHIPLPPPVTVP